MSSDLWQLVNALQNEVLALKGRELYMCSDDIIWHRDGDRMIPLTDEGKHVDPTSFYVRRTASLRGMQTPDKFPTIKQLQALQPNVPLAPVTELDVVRRHVRILEARLARVEGEVPGT